MNEDVKWTSLGLKGISKAFKEKGYEVSEYWELKHCLVKFLMPDLALSSFHRVPIAHWMLDETVFPVLLASCGSC